MFKTTSFAIPKEYNELLDEMVELNLFRFKSDIIRNAISLLVEKDRQLYKIIEEQKKNAQNQKR